MVLPWAPRAACRVRLLVVHQQVHYLVEASWHVVTVAAVSLNGFRLNLILDHVIVIHALFVLAV